MRSTEVWFAIPSASVARCRQNLPLWREKGYRIAVLQNVERGEIPADIVEWSDTYPGWAESINILCRRIVPRSAGLVVSGGCDMQPDPRHTADELAAQFFERFPDGFGVMQPHGDSFMQARHYCGSPFLGRAWIDTMYGGTGPMHGGYRHNWADNELYWVARCLGALWERPDLSHFHAHFTRDGGEEKPAWWVSNVERYDRQDLELFIRRKWTRFPGHEPRGLDRTLDPRPLFEDKVLHAERAHEALYGGRGKRLLTEALERCAARGLTPVAIYGAGRHTRNLGEAMMDPPVDVACIIDDDARAHGRRLWGRPVVSRAQALGSGVRAVILSSDAHEGAMWDKCAGFFRAGAQVMRLYDPSAQEKNTRIARAIAQCAAAGLHRLAIYGAGAHTRDLTWGLQHPEAQVMCVIDDAAGPGKVAGLPVVDLAMALALRPQAVILSSNRHESAMLARCEPFTRAGVRVIPLYRSAGAQSPTVEQAA